MTPAAVERVYRDIDLKRRVASRLDGSALVVEGETSVLLSAKEANP
jgi:ribonuclease PH